MTHGVATSESCNGIFLMKFFVLPPRIYDVGALCTSIFVGHVSTTAGCSNVKVGSACFIGFVAGAIYLGASALLQKLHVDDPFATFALDEVLYAAARSLQSWARLNGILVG